MTTIEQQVNALHWARIQNALHHNGYAVIPGVLTHEQCTQLKADYQHGPGYRKTVNMERYRFGRGEYKYYDYPLPPVIADLRKHIYPHIAPVANRWMEALKIDTRFPATHAEMLERCRAQGQLKPTALILSYGAGGFNTLHQDLYGEVYFPMQAVFLLDQAGFDFSGGEFVLTEQIPRAQSKVTVLQPGKGDMVIFTTQFRPQSGSKGFYRVQMKHGVSTVHSGERHSMGIIFHDGLS